MHTKLEDTQLTSAAALAKPRSTLETLASIDWSFTDEDTSYSTHNLHPYPAKFIPQIPANLIARLSMPGDTVLDPFGGSATTAVEAVRLRRRAISLDANPLAALIGRAKTTFLTQGVKADLDRLHGLLERRTKEASFSRQHSLSVARPENPPPNIPNIEKWFQPDVVDELQFLTEAIERHTVALARDIAYVALSRIIVRVSNQESETRYVAVEKDLPKRQTIRLYLGSLGRVIRQLHAAADDFQYSDVRFLLGDTRSDLASQLPRDSVDLIVTSPPYANATDYHLYHRFRMFWLGFDPRPFGKIEIGSHLRHQRDRSGFDAYLEDLQSALEQCKKVLAPGRYACFVVGDARFQGEIYQTSQALSATASSVGFQVLGVIDRPVHQNKRSFSKPARRARVEQLVLLRKPNTSRIVWLAPPPYRMWDYEGELRTREIQSLTGARLRHANATEPVRLRLGQPALWQVRRLTFTQGLHASRKDAQLQPTWQSWLESGDASPRGRKDPKYATHGVHPFKGKFYPQLAKCLINLTGCPVGSRLLDPYCGSGTSLLEGMLNGFATYGVDLNPLAVKIAVAKTSILTVQRAVVESTVQTMLDRLSTNAPCAAVALQEFPEETHAELERWFPMPVVYKIHWLLEQARSFSDPELVGFLEILVSSLIRQVSQQDPADLRIRRRRPALEDAPVLELFRDSLNHQYNRIKNYWSVAGRQPGHVVRPNIAWGDSRKPETLRGLGLRSGSVDCVVTSPPYATALPYIDTDRLSLLAVLGLSSRKRSRLETSLTGSREIGQKARRQAEAELLDDSARQELPDQVVDLLRGIYEANRAGNVGFRRANMAALLWRYFIHMRENLTQVRRVLKVGAKALYVVGDSRTKAGGTWTAITTCASIRQIGAMAGLRHVESLPIDVTRDNHRHAKNAITKNRVEVFEKP